MKLGLFPLALFFCVAWSETCMEAHDSVAIECPHGTMVDIFHDCGGYCQGTIDCCIVNPCTSAMYQPALYCLDNCPQNSEGCGLVYSNRCQVACDSYVTDPKCAALKASRAAWCSWKENTFCDDTTYAKCSAYAGATTRNAGAATTRNAGAATTRNAGAATTGATPVIDTGFEKFETFKQELSWEKTNKKNYEYIARSPIHTIGVFDFITCVGASVSKCVYSFSTTQLDYDPDGDYAVVIIPEWASAVTWKPDGATIKVEADGKTECLEQSKYLVSKAMEFVSGYTYGTLAICNPAKKEYKIEITGHHKQQDKAGILTDLPMPMAFGFGFYLYLDKKSRYCQERSKPCVFPFVYKGRTYNGCTTKNHERYWCATKVDSDNNCYDDCDDEYWANCKDTDRRHKDECVFPFIYDDKKYYHCTDAGLTRLNHWCAIEVDKDGEEKEYANCKEDESGNPIDEPVQDSGSIFDTLVQSYIEGSCITKEEEKQNEKIKTQQQQQNRDSSDSSGAAGAAAFVFALACSLWVF